MKRPGCEFERLEANLASLRSRFPAAPTTAILVNSLLQHVARRLAEMLEEQLRPFGLVETEFKVLMMLFSQAEGFAHPSDLCARTSQRPANMSRICDALVARELITRVASAEDRRRMVLRLTRQGEALVERLLPVLFPNLEALFADESAAQMEAWIDALKRLGVKLETRRAAALEAAV
jgi:MarR family transcriptional repressor of emrRAB